MSVKSSFLQERAELEIVLNSGIFARSPSLAQFLQYICEKYFEGHAEEIKEYNVAVEALGRPAHFDQKRDSIVRVEAHRLRKRLHEYYREQGADHALQITIPPGNYVPHFVPRTNPAPEEGSVDANNKTAELAGNREVTSPESADMVAPGNGDHPLNGSANGQELVAVTPTILHPAVVGARHSHVIRYAAIGAVAAAIIVSAFILDRVKKDSSVPSQRAAVIAQASSGSPEDEVRILAGSTTPKIVDHYGNTWYGDRYFHDGTAASVAPRPIARSQDGAIFYNRREGTFGYNIPLKNGPYELRLYFAETVFGDNNIAGGGETTRLFHIRANGTPLVEYFDVIADAGGSNTADIKVFKDIIPAGDGMLHLDFVSTTKEFAFVNAIEIVPSIPGAIRPIRIVARDATYTDHSNRVWSADRYFHGGMLVQRHEAIAGTDDDSIYQNERYGNFTYTVPVAQNGRYRVTLKFCENWFGPNRMGGGGANTRVFDVHLNGRTLLHNFDIYKEAGSLRALDKVFPNIEPNAQGKLILNFVPIRNYAMINAVEVVDEAWK